MNMYIEAKVLYDGGWRSADKEELIDEYDFDLDQAEELCEILKEIEQEEN